MLLLSYALDTVVYILVTLHESYASEKKFVYITVAPKLT